MAAAQPFIATLPPRPVSSFLRPSVISYQRQSMEGLNNGEVSSTLKKIFLRW